MMITQIDELKRQLSIHIDSLHMDAQEQAMLANTVGEIAAEAKMVARQKKMEHEEARAASDKEIRRSPEKYGLVKVTESSVSSAIVLHPEVQRTRDEWIQAERDADIAASLRDAYQHRKSMLQMETELYVSNYFGEVEVNQNSLRRSRQVGVKQIEEQLENARKEKTRND